MKKIIILFLFIPMQLFAQIKGDIILTKNQEISVNKTLIKFLESQFDTTYKKDGQIDKITSKIISWEGQTKVLIPFVKIFKKNILTRKVDIEGKKYLAQYEVTSFSGSKYITLFDFQTKMKEFDFKNGTIKKDKVWKNNDNESFFKPNKDKIKEKLKKIKIKDVKP